MDRPGDEAIDRDRLVDRGVEGDADDATDRVRRARSRCVTSRRPRRPARPPRPPRGSAWPSVPPAARVDSDPHATASRSAASSGRPSSQAARNPASNESPAPVVSTASTGGRGGPGQRAVRARPPAPPSAPSFTATVRRGTRRRTRGHGGRASRSSTPASARHSAALGSSTSASAAAAREPAVPCRPTDPSWGRGWSSPPPRGPPGTAPGARRPAPAGGSSCRRGRAAPDASSAAGTSAARTSAIVPIAVRIARSVPLPRITEAPVGSPGATRHADTSTPRSASASSVNRPSASSPTTPTRLTRSPSRAAPHAVIADELPMVSRIPSTNRSACPKTGRGSRSADDDVGVDLADDEQVDVAGPPQYRSYQPGPGVSGRRAAAQRGRQGTATQSTRSVSRASRARAPSRRGTGRGHGSIAAASAHTGPPDQHAARARLARDARPGARTSRRRRPPDSSTHGTGVAASSSAHASRQRPSSVTPARRTGTRP